uniref:Secreted protein n=1 Tax=Anguilla anguilla TaxID=7936 RepID=A0A0E9TEZ0_ANGAN
MCVSMCVFGRVYVLVFWMCFPSKLSDICVLPSVALPDCYASRVWSNILSRSAKDHSG